MTHLVEKSANFAEKRKICITVYRLLIDDVINSKLIVPKNKKIGESHSTSHFGAAMTFEVGVRN